MFEDTDQAKDLFVMLQAMDNMDQSPVCASFPEAYFPTHDMPLHSEEVVWAKKMCQECPIIQLCADFAIKWDSTGVWGGTSHEERRRIRKLRNITKGVLHPVPGMDD